MQHHFALTHDQSGNELSFSERCRRGDRSIATDCPYGIWRQYDRESEFEQRRNKIQAIIDQYVQELADRQEDYARLMQEMRYEDDYEDSKINRYAKQQAAELASLQMRVDGLKQSLAEQRVETETQKKQVYFNVMTQADPAISQKIMDSYAELASIKKQVIEAEMANKPETPIEKFVQKIKTIISL